MSFADWKKRSKQFTDLYGRFGQTRLKAIETACQAAFKAGERNGRKQVEAIAENCIGLAVLAEREVCANICDQEQGTAGDAADKIRRRHNVEFSGGAPLHGAASAGTKGYASGDENE